MRLLLAALAVSFLAADAQAGLRARRQANQAGACSSAAQASACGSASAVSACAPAAAVSACGPATAGAFLPPAAVTQAPAVMPAQIIVNGQLYQLVK